MVLLLLLLWIDSFEELWKAVIIYANGCAGAVRRFIFIFIAREGAESKSRRTVQLFFLFWFIPLGACKKGRKAVREFFLLFPYRASSKIARVPLSLDRHKRVARLIWKRLWDDRDPNFDG